MPRYERPERTLNRWVAPVVSAPETPGWTIFAPAENPGMWCGTIEPRPMTKSASSTGRAMLTGVPFGVTPRSTICSRSCHGLLITRTRPVTSGP